MQIVDNPQQESSGVERPKVKGKSPAISADSREWREDYIFRATDEPGWTTYIRQVLIGSPSVT